MAELERLESEQKRLIQIAQGSSKVSDNVAAFLPNLIERFKTLIDNLSTVTQYQVG